MKKNVKCPIAFFLSLIFSLCLCMTAFADGHVTYEGNAQKFIFAPGSGYSPTDLFEDFKSVMPGDIITQHITVKNDVKNKTKIKLYLRSLGAQKGSEDFLSQLELSVPQNGDSDLFNAPADRSAQLTDWVYLGTFYSGAQIDLTVTLQVPPDLDNTYQDAIGYLDWQFKVEELPVEEDDPAPPKTGDGSHVALYAALCAVSGLGIAALLLCRRKAPHAAE